MPLNSTSNKELPPIATCALPQPKHNLANVLDVGCLFCLVCAIPLAHLLAIHRQLDNGVVLVERLPILNGFAFKLVFHVLRQRGQPTSQCPYEFVVLCLALSLCLLDQLVALAHIVAYHLNERLPCLAYVVLDLLLVGRAFCGVLGDVLQHPTIYLGHLVVQRLVCEDVGASNVP